MTSQSRTALRDGGSIPQVGLGVFQTPQNITCEVVKTALRAGYRHVDTAAIYENEIGVGEGIRASNIARNDIFVTTKLWNDDQGYDSTLRACEESLRRLKVDTIDLYLIHWPSPHRHRYVDTWKALVRLRQEGRAQSIWVSNFEPEHLDRIIGETGTTPVLNQIELHPRFQQRKLRDVHAKLGIATESWSPLGQGTLVSDPTIAAIAAKHRRTPAQILIRWHVDNNLIVIPKSVTPSRIHENIDIFGFALDDDDLANIARLDAADGRIGPNPMTARF